MGEVVLCFAVIGVLVWGLQVHQVEDVEGDCDEENFHYGIVGGDVGEEEVHVTSAEDYQVNFLGLRTDTVAFFVSVNFVYDDNKGKKVKEVAGKLKEVYHFYYINSQI